MAKTATMKVIDQDLIEPIRQLFHSILKQEEIAGILTPRRLPMKNMVMPALITDPENLDDVDPLSPAFPMNAAKVVARLTRKDSGSIVAAVMRPCEIRAFFELVKLKQGRTDDLLIIGIDCLGAFQNRDFFQWADENGEAATNKFYSGVLTKDGPVADALNLAPACLVCEHPVPDGADIAIGIFGIDADNRILVQAQTEKGEEVLAKLALTGGTVPASRQKTINQLIAERTAARDRMLADTHAATDSLEALTGYLANCVNCYNCRVACPVCYCRECVFVTDVFDHEPYQYLLWANKKGIIKMPTDTVFYHITRLAHMSTACVGCGQCSNACPNDIPVMELFRTIANNTQQAFDYVAGRSLDERPPLSEFREEEFEEVVGI